MKKQAAGWERRVARLIAFGIILYALVLNLSSAINALNAVLATLTPIIIGLVFALILDVPMHAFENLFIKLDRRKRMSAKLQDVLSLILAVIFVPLILFVLIKFVLPQFINAITNVVNIIVANEAKITAFVAKIGLDPAMVSDFLTDITTWITNNLGLITGTAISTVVTVFSSVMDVALGVILSIYILADKTAIKRRVARVVRAFLPDRTSKNVLRCGPMFISTFRTFLGRQCLEAVILGVLLLGCLLIFRIPYAFTIACMTAIMALIPYIGAYISLAVGIVLVFTSSPLKALIFAVIFLVAQQVEGNVIYPKVVGKSVGLPSYVTLSAVVIGGAIAGIPGMFFIIPVVSVFYTLLREAVQKRNAEKDAALAKDEAAED